MIILLKNVYLENLTETMFSYYLGVDINFFIFINTF